jgi:Tol biopolymer transport system component
LGLAALIYRYAPLLTGRGGPSDAAVPHLTNAVKVTSAISVEDYPTWSPDGRAIAYHSDKAGHWDIWVTPLGGSQAVNRTAESPADERFPRWSPDGRWIVFHSTKDGGGYYVMPGIGGAARRIAPCPEAEADVGPAEWSPDSAQVAYVSGQRIRPCIEVLRMADGSSRKLCLPVNPKSNVVRQMSWSPDGRWLAYDRSLSRIAATCELWLMRISDGESFQLEDALLNNWNPVWSPDSRDLYFISARRETGDLWKLSIGEDGRPRGARRQVTSGIEILQAALSADGRKLAYTKGLIVRNVFRAPLLEGRPATWADTVQLTDDEAKCEFVDVFPDGRLLFSSNRSGNADIYMISADGGELRQLTTDPAVDAGPRWSPDGSQMVFYSARTGHREIWIMPLDGGPARQLTRGRSESLYPAWSPTGNEIVKRRDGLSVVSVPDGRERSLIEAGIGHQPTYPDWSPDGRWVAFHWRSEGGARIWRVPASGGPPEPLTKGEGGLPRWSVDGERVYFIGHGDRLNNVWSVSLASGEERPETAFAGRRGSLGTLGLAIDARFMYFTWEELRADIWVADLVQPPDK